MLLLGRAARHDAAAVMRATAWAVHVHAELGNDDIASLAQSVVQTMPGQWCRWPNWLADMPPWAMRGERRSRRSVACLSEKARTTMEHDDCGASASLSLMRALRPVVRRLTMNQTPANNVRVSIRSLETESNSLSSVRGCMRSGPSCVHRLQIQVQDRPAHFVSSGGNSRCLREQAVVDRLQEIMTMHTQGLYDLPCDDPMQRASRPSTRMTSWPTPHAHLVRRSSPPKSSPSHAASGASFGCTRITSSFCGWSPNKLFGGACISWITRCWAAHDDGDGDPNEDLHICAWQAWPFVACNYKNHECAAPHKKLFGRSMTQTHPHKMRNICGSASFVVVGQSLHEDEPTALHIVRLRMATPLDARSPKLEY